MEPFLITLTGESDAYPIFQHEGVEFIHMIEGSVVYRHGERSYELNPGDSLFFDAEAPHGPLEMRRLPCRYLSVIASVAASP
jgi:quercetin dioxygenase-like cupin family protein